MGGFHRAHLATYVDELATAGGDWGIAGLGLLEGDARMAAVMAAQDRLYTVIERGAGQPRASIVGSVAEFVHAPPARFAAAAKVIADPRTAILSLTVTEAGYGEPAAGEESTFDRLAVALALRRADDAGPLTVLSCDNLPGNGAAARRVTLAAAERHGGGLAGWIEANCSFPASMVDRITPVTEDRDRDWLRDAIGVDDAWPVVCEPFRQWVVEDDFIAGRPAFEDVGVIFSDRVGDWETYKLRFLNAGHSGFAYLAALAGIEAVDEAMAVPELAGFVRGLLQREALPTVTEIPGHPREDYIETVLERFANPGVSDQVARLCVDGSAKFTAFLIPTVLSRVQRGESATRAATALAGWARYLRHVDPHGRPSTRTEPKRAPTRRGRWPIPPRSSSSRRSSPRPAGLGELPLGVRRRLPPRRRAGPAGGDGRRGRAGLNRRGAQASAWRWRAATRSRRGARRGTGPHRRRRGPDGPSRGTKFAIGRIAIDSRPSSSVTTTGRRTIASRSRIATWGTLMTGVAIDGAVGARGW